MGFKCGGVKLWVELDMECTSCKHNFKVEYSATNKYAIDKTVKDFYKGSYKMCPKCQELSTVWDPMWMKEEDSDYPKYDLGFQKYCCPERDGPGEDYYHVFNEKGEEIMRWRR